MVSTLIDPEVVPSGLGSRIISERPSSSTVVVKSVPLIKIEALGVSMEMFSLSILPGRQ